MKCPTYQPQNHQLLTIVRTKREMRKHCGTWLKMNIYIGFCQEHCGSRSHQNQNDYTESDGEELLKRSSISIKGTVHANMKIVA